MRTTGDWRDNGRQKNERPKVGRPGGQTPTPSRLLPRLALAGGLAASIAGGRAAPASAAPATTTPATTTPATTTPATAPAKPPAGGGEEIDSARVKPLDVKVPDEFVTRKDPKGRVTVRSPAGWREVPVGGEQAALFLRTGKAATSVNVVVTDWPPGDTLSKGVEALPGKLSDSGKFKDFRHIRTDYIRVAGRPAGRVVYEAVFGSLTLRFMQVLVLERDKVVILTYTAPADSFDSLYPTIEQVVASMELP